MNRGFLNCQSASTTKMSERANYEKYGSERESVKGLDLRCFLRSEIFSHGQCSTAAFGENGRNLRLRYGIDAPGTRCDTQLEIPNHNPRRLETRTHRGFPHFHSDDGCRRFSAMNINPAKIVDLVRFLHRTKNTSLRGDRVTCEINPAALYHGIVGLITLVAGVTARSTLSAQPNLQQ